MSDLLRSVVLSVSVVLISALTYLSSAGDAEIPRAALPTIYSAPGQH
jgi:hypothetical protein